MTNQLTIEYGAVAKHEDLSEEVHADRLLEEIRRIKRRFEDGLDAPYGVDVVNDRGDRMTIGFDEHEGFLMFQPSSDQEWTRYSVGDVKRNDSKIFYLPQWSEVSAKYMVPTRKLLEALQDWAGSGEFSDKIDWTTELFL